MNHSYLFTNIIAFIVTIIILKAATPVAFKVNLVDKPTQRKQHSGLVPLIGGISIGIGFCIGILLLNISLSHFRALLASYLLLIVVGVLDDFNEVSPRLRILVQVIVGLLVSCWGMIQFQSLGAIFSQGSINLGFWAVPVTVFLVVAMINANNMLDGLNGLAGGTSFIALAFLAYAAYCADAFKQFHFLLTFLSCLLAFLCFNFPVLRYKKRLIFLGDAGSTSLGLMIAWFGIELTQAPSQFLKPAYLIWIIIVPVFDLISVTLRRVVLKRSSPLAADREHVHHLLATFGLKKSYVTFSLALIAFLGGLTGIMMAKYQVNEMMAFWSYTLLFIVYFIFANLCWRRLQH